MKEAIRAKHMDFENAFERKNFRMEEDIRAKHMDFENAPERKNLRMKKAIRAKHMDFENALRSRPLIYQSSSDKKNDFDPPSRQLFVTTLSDYLKGARSLVAKADDLQTELVKLLWTMGIKHEEISSMQQSLI
ncbi:hypothetical protein Tco_0977140 [Tanacetum coccineum]|uniref:Uncharacterized protein n=1 Tax=Tanacetum coccineum TaxID=301880 RepID=A0ABQ5EJ99_9ASTR